MSVVSNILLTAGGIRWQQSIDKINVWLDSVQQSYLVEVSGHISGRKCFEAGLWGTAANYLNVFEFLECVAHAGWDYPESVRVFIKDQHDDYFRAFKLKFCYTPGMDEYRKPANWTYEELE